MLKMKQENTQQLMLLLHSKKSLALSIANHKVRLTSKSAMLMNLAPQDKEKRKLISISTALLKTL